MLNFLGKILDSNEREIDKLKPIVDAVNALEPDFKKLSDSKLKAKTAEFKKRLEDGETLDELLPEAFAAVREASRRTIGQRHFDVQIMGGTTLHQGKIAEMRTGEGKTLVATLPLYLNSLTGKGVHLVTVNDYLAKRDAEWMGPIFHALGVSVGVINHEVSYIFDPNPRTEKEEEGEIKMDPELSLSPEQEGLGVGKFLREINRREAYYADITYGTNNEYGFDYLRDNMAQSFDTMVQRDPNFAIVDEVDSILIDEARTPLIISQAAEESTEKYYQFAKMIERLNPETDFVIDEKMRTSNLTEIGISKIERALGVDNLYEKDFDTVHHLEEALKAKALFLKDRDYVVKDGEVIIVDEFTGRLMPGRRYSEGLHQAIEAKENVEIQRESQTLATISFQNYFRLYDKLAGMTGTASTSAEEFHKVYTLDVVIVPTNKPAVREDLPDLVYKNDKAKYEAIVKEIAELHKKGQPVLVGTTSIDKNELLGNLLKRKGVPHQLLNAKNHEKEAQIIADAGQKGAVTMATNIAGRGVDIKLGEGVAKLGGLFVLGTERHEARRIDNQLRGRSGRQGDPGATRFFVSLQDDIMRLFGGDAVERVMNAFKLPDDVPIEAGLVSKAIEQAQGRVEGNNFDARKRVVDYDDVMNKQREIIYSMRRELLELTDPKNEDKEEAQKELRAQVLDKIDEAIELLVGLSSGEAGTINHEEALNEFFTIVPFDEASKKEISKKIEAEPDPEKIKTEFKKITTEIFENREKQLGNDLSREIEKVVMLSVIDTLWISHLDDVDDLREGVGLRGYAGRDPLVEYKNEAYKLFEKLVDSIDYEIVHRIFKVQLVPNEQTNASTTTGHEGHVHTHTQTQPQTTQRAIAEDKIGRNDPCPCGSGLKYKKCGLINSPQHQENLAKVKA
ncbi:MAG TPA: preprotein translocase subunit SecA [Candidatus Saccharimonadales bacterium]|nr:preprotein translocase subunit SecA [Candidatus Saccharimonadales bacterium]